MGFLLPYNALNFRLEKEKPAEKFIKVWGEKNNLSDETITKLEKSAIASEAALVALTEKKVRQLRLNIGQRKKLNEAIAEIHIKQR